MAKSVKQGAKPLKQNKVQYRAIHALSYKGERVERGAILELSALDLDQINTSHIERVNVKKEEKQKKEEDKIKEEAKEGTEIDL